ncbi:MAG TPA: biotin--[acetyl-CoA-carboxylase] ligase [Natronosporangium sp.]
MELQPERPPLPESSLREAVLRGSALWREMRVVAETGSSNADVAAAARAGAAEGLIVVAEHQRAGRGRTGRSWSSPPRAGLAVSVLLRPAVPPTRLGWLPLLAGVALAESVHRETGLLARLKWPNDLLIGGRKCAGILAEAVGVQAVVVGIGLNVTLRADELPIPEATSLALAGARTTDRTRLLVALLAAIEAWYGRWRDAAGDPDASGLRPAYLRACATIGQRVRALLPDGTEPTGTATTVDPDGRLVLALPAGPRAVAAGDITHLRPAD